MTNINFARNELIEINGDQFKVFNRTQLGSINLEHVTDGYMITRTNSELASLWQKGELIRVPDNAAGTMKEKERQMLLADYNSFPEKARRAAERRMDYVKAVMDANPRFHTPALLDPIIIEVAARRGDAQIPTARRVSEWAKLYCRNGTPDQSNIRWLAPRYHLRGNSFRRFCAPVEELCWDVIDREFLKRKPASAKEIHGMIVLAVEKMRVDGIDPIYRTKDGKALLCPSLVTIRRWLRSIDREIVTRAQRGPVEAKRKHEPVLRGPQGERPMQEVEIDHHLCDIILVDDTRNIVLGRPWLTLGLCRYTRDIVGFELGFHSPSAYTVGLCLRHICSPKDEEFERYPDLDGTWPTFGVPETIIVDNGPEFDSATFMAGCYGLGIDVVRAPVRTPQYKGKVERLFGRITRDFVQTIDGTTFSNEVARGDYKSEKRAICSLSDFRRFFVRWVTKIYRIENHRGIGVSPGEKWEEATRNHSVRLPSDVSQLDTLLAMTAMRALTRKGIEYEGLIYNSKDPEFRALINAPDKPAKVNLRINADDMNSMVMENWRDGSLHHVPSVDPEYTEGLRLEMHHILKARAKLKLKAHQRVTVRLLMLAREEIRQEIQELKRKKKLSKRISAALGEEEFNARGPGFDFNRNPGDFVQAPIVLPRAANAAPQPPDAGNDDTDLEAIAAALGFKS